MDDPSLTTKLRRYWDVGTTVGGLATRLVGQEYLGRAIDDQAYAKDLKARLGTMKGPLMKAAQFLATIPDAIPIEYAQKLWELQSQAPAMGVPFVKRRMSSELGPDWSQLFQSFDLKACAAASLGQVHQAITQDGQKVACKLQYPQMQAIIETDLQQLKTLLGIYHSWHKAVDMTEVQTEIKDRLLEELDYVHEAQQIQIYQKIFHQTEEIQIPKVYPSLSTSRLLTMSWMDGKPILNYLDSSKDFRNSLADRLFMAWYRPFYHHGVIHGDPHPGNYLVTTEGTLQLLDFGCVRHFSKSFVQGVVHLYHAFLHNRPKEAVSAYESWGFQNLTNDLIEIMNDWARLLYDPLLDDQVRPIQKNFSAAHGWQVATAVYEKLRQRGGVRPPKEFVFMDRAAVGLGGVFMRLKVERNWHRLFEEILENKFEFE